MIKKKVCLKHKINKHMKEKKETVLNSKDVRKNKIMPSKPKI